MKKKNIYLFRLYFSENLLAQKVNEFLNRENNNGYNIKEIENLIKKNTRKRRNPLYRKTKRSNHLSAFGIARYYYGRSGTGKSTIIKAIIEALIELAPSEMISEKIALLAPTGRAAKRLNEVCRFPAQTIHRFLGYEGQGIFKLDRKRKPMLRLSLLMSFRWSI
jgi:exodeoxyribonuclease V alpha subunit